MFETIIHWNFARFDVKDKTIFSNKYCDLLLHASFTKLIGPALLFLNNRITCYLNFIFSFVIFLLKSPCRFKKTLQSPKKLAISVKLTLQSCPLITNIVIKRYTWSINLETFRWKLSNFWIYSWANIVEIHWWCLQNIHTFIHLYKNIHLVYWFRDFSLKIEHFLNLFGSQFWILTWS